MSQDNIVTGNSKITAFGEVIEIIYQSVKPPVPEKNYWCDQDYLYLEVADVANYLVDSRQNTIYIEKSPNLIDDYSINTWLFGTVFAYVLQQRGYLVLHGSAVLINNKAVIFSGDSGAGKSTLAAKMVSLGYPLLTDDVVAILRNQQTGLLELIPGPTRVKLWTEALSKLGVKSEGLKQVVNKQDKYELPIANHHHHSVPISHFYELNHDPHISVVSSKQVQATDKISLLVQNTYRYSMLKPIGKLGLHLKQVAELAQTIKVFKIERPSQLFLLDELVNCVHKNL